MLASFLFTGCVTVNSPVSATSNPVGSKVGTSSGTIYLGIFGTADAGMKAAAANGGITKISTVDTQVETFLGYLMVTVTTTVTGE